MKTKRELINIWKNLWLSLKIIEEVILSKTGLSKSQFFSSWDNIEIKEDLEIEDGFNRCSSWEPIEYIINKAEFYWIDFFVDNRVLIPRNDTEILVKEALKEAWNILVDIWTGSSCIAISIIKNTSYFEKCYVVDISSKALEVSKINIKKHWLKDIVEQVEWDLLSPPILLNKWSVKLKDIIITANLPYIKNWDHNNMSQETIKHEPSIALYWWESTGFELYEELIQQILELIKINKLNKITLFIEIWFDQYEYSKRYLKSLNLKHKHFKDNSWVYRCIKIEFWK